MKRLLAAVIAGAALTARRRARLRRRGRLWRWTRPMDRDHLHHRPVRLHLGDRHLRASRKGRSGWTRPRPRSRVSRRP
ncbi:hypothetical protein ACRAWD_28765 [Caulobacter segnis]